MNIKNILVYISCMVMCCGTITSTHIKEISNIVVSAEDEESQYSNSCGKNATYSVDETTGTLTISGTGDMDYTNPSNFSYGWDNYNDIYFIKTIVIEDGITSISDGAFSGCTSLESITIPDSVTSIGDNAFTHCALLKSITIPDSVTSIGKWAFESCESLNSVTLSKNVTSIGFKAFQYCKSLTEINIPDSVTSIGEWAFSCCTSLETIHSPDSVTSIADCSFSGCESLKEIIIPDGVTSIGNCSFYGCESLEKIIIPDGVTSIGKEAFSYCTSLKEITIPDTVTKIGENALDSSNLIIRGVKGSKAEKYAKENNFDFVNIEENTSPILDILNLKKCILGVSTDSTNLDYNSDGDINILDLNSALKKYLEV